MPDTDRVHITLDQRGRSAKVEINGVEIRYITKLTLSLDGTERMSRVMIELAPDVIEIDGEVSVLELVKPNRVFIPRAAEVVPDGV